MTTDIPMEERIRRKLTEAFAPHHLDIRNDSAKHAGHAGDDGSGETHFKVHIVSAAFDALSRLDRQRRIYEILDAEMKGGLHALALKIQSPREYESM